MQTNTGRTKTQRTKPRRDWKDQQAQTQRKEKRNHEHPIH
jgi:hypothetical protein